MDILEDCSNYGMDDVVSWSGLKPKSIVFMLLDIVIQHNYIAGIP